jgi:hypothetical protein
VDAIPSGCDDAPAFVLRHGVGHGADANCHVGIGAVPALQYRHGVIATTDRLSGAARRRAPAKTSIKEDFREVEDRGTARGAAIRIAVASIKMSVGRFDDALKLGEHLASWRSAAGAASAVAAALSDRRFDCLLPAIGL